MTKRKYLKASFFLTLFILAIMAFITWSIKADLDKYVPASTDALTLDKAFIVFAAATGFLALNFLIKKIAAKVEKNGLTLFVMLLDAVCIAFFVLLFNKSIPLIIAGQIMDYIFEAATLVLSALAFILDLFSLPAERWG